MNKIMKFSGVVVSIMLAGSVTMADPNRGDYRGRGDYDRGGSRGYSDYRGDRGGHYDSGRSSYRGYSDIRIVHKLHLADEDVNEKP